MNYLKKIDYINLKYTDSNSGKMNDVREREIL